MKYDVNVAIIDDGVNNFYIKDLTLLNDLEINDNMEIINREINDPYLPSHGTYCAGIINKYANLNIFISSLKIIDKYNRSIPEKLVMAIDWCIKSNMDIINLSLGTINFNDYQILNTIIFKAQSAGIIIVAACHNKSIFTIPASLSNAIGVKSNENYYLNQTNHIFLPYNLDGIEIVTNAKHSLELFNGETVYTKSSNSFAAPLITVKIANFFSNKGKKSLMDTKYFLATSSTNLNYRFYNQYMSFRIDWIFNSVILRINSSKIPNYGHTEFNIINIYEIDTTNNNCFFKLLEILKFVNNSSLIDSLIVFGDKKCVKSTDMNILLIQLLKLVKKNLVLLVDEKAFYLSLVYLCKNNIKIWHTKMANLLLKKNYYEVNCKEPTIPILLVFSKIDELLINFIYSLKSFYQMDGYNASAISNISFGIINRIDYFPTHLFTTKYINHFISLFTNILSSDIFIIGFCNKNLSDQNTFKIEKLLNSDVKLLVDQTYNYPKQQLKEFDIKIFWNKNKNGEYSNSSCLNDNYFECYKFINNLFKY